MDLIEVALPSDAKPRMDSALPPRTKLRTLTDEPICTLPMIDALRKEPIRAMPEQLKDEPKRIMLRTLRQLAIVTKSKADIFLPPLMMERTLTELAQFRNCITDAALLHREKLLIDTVEPMLMASSEERHEPRRTDCLIDMVLPKDT
jgi:hypothetical protein